MGSFGGQRLDPSDFGIGFNGGFMDILDRLQRQGGHRGPPPASKKVVEALKVLEYSDETKDISHDYATCAVCKDDFEKGDKILLFPCPNKHIYHKDCITPWLKLHNSCPVCRHELKTDDEWYERMKAYRSNYDSNSPRNPPNPPPPPPSGT